MKSWLHSAPTWLGDSPDVHAPTAATGGTAAFLARLAGAVVAAFVLGHHVALAQFNRNSFGLSFGMKPFEFWLEIPYTKKKLKMGSSYIHVTE